MVFTSPVFVFIFLPSVIFLYFFANDRIRNLVLLGASLLFYAWGEPVNVLVMLFSIGVNYLVARLIEKREKKKLLLALAVAVDVGFLFVFKYLNFTVDLFNRATGLGLAVRRIALPIGISFYTFQIMSYTIDVYRGSCETQKNILDLALYVSFFPQLIAGPIVRYVDIAAQIRNRRTDTENIRSGLVRFALGFSKKVLIADQLAPLADMAFSGAQPSWMLKWAGIAAYTLQIYYDFSGYSDMAIGLGEMFGFHFLENFDYPYISKSIQEFWRRWHISLSSWFRDYVYIPLGGNRKGKGRTYLNLLIVFTVTGLWHGASLNFLVWGLYHGFFLIIERIGFGKVLKKVPAVLRHLYTILIVMIGWVFFRAENLSAAVAYIRDMFTAAGRDGVRFLYVMNRQYAFCIAAGILFAMPLLPWVRKWTNAHPAAYSCIVLAVFVLSLCYTVGSGFSPFLYFRF